MNFMIKRGQLSYLRDILDMPALIGTESRIRTRFKKKILELIAESEEERQLLIDEYALKDEDGQYKFVEGTKIIDMGGEENTLIVWNNVESLHQEICTIPCNIDNKKMFEVLSSVMLEGKDLRLNGVHADIYDELCEQFENILEYYKKDTKEGE